jgi:hypothetical protein
MNKSSEGYHWVICQEVIGVGQRVFYIKVFGHMPAKPIRVSLEILDESDEKIHQLNYIEAVSGVATIEEVLESGNYMKVDDKQLLKLNGGDERDDDDEPYLKNVKLKVTFGS